MPTLKVKVPDELYADFEKFLKQRKMNVNEYVELRMQQAVNEFQKDEGYSLDSVLKFGKYRGSTIKIVIKTDPNYILWNLKNNDQFSLAPEAMELLEEIYQG